MAYDSFFTVSSAAADRRLLTQSDFEEIIGVDYSGQIPILNALLLQVSDLIASYCRVPQGGTTPPTLKSETIVETFRRNRRLSRGAWPFVTSEDIYNPIALSRYPVYIITSVVADGSPLSASDYELTAAEGRLYFLAAGTRAAWTAEKIVVTYSGGLDPVPEDLKLAAIRIVREQISESSRDPLLRSETIEGIGKIDYWVNAASGSAEGLPIAGVTAAMLERYRYPML